MRLTHWTAVLALSTIAIAPAANAANLVDCVKMARQVASAFETAQPGANTDLARSQENAGRMYCNSSMYDRGVASYSKALQLLGKA